MRCHRGRWSPHSLQERVPQNVTDNDNADNYRLLKRGKRKDYFTGALPWAQRGEPTYLPLGTHAPVLGNGNGLMLTGFPWLKSDLAGVW